VEELHLMAPEVQLARVGHARLATRQMTAVFFLLSCLSAAQSVAIVLYLICRKSTGCSFVDVANNYRMHHIA